MTSYNSKNTKGKTTSDSAKKQFDRKSKNKSTYDSKKKPFDRQNPDKRFQKRGATTKKEPDKGIRLNRYIANAGICSRRNADTLIDSGCVKHNGKTVTEMGIRVMPSDVVTYKGKVLKIESLKYILLNKPKDYITTFDDPQNRKTVMDLVKLPTKERIYPVGRLDRQTTGLLLLTNDGDLTKKLSHPSSGISKVYQVHLDQPVTKKDFEQLIKGIVLDDGPIAPDTIAYVDNWKEVIGISLHSGRNGIVRRMFEHLGYQVKKLDRVIFAGLTKKNVPWGNGAN